MFLSDLHGLLTPFVLAHVDLLVYILAVTLDIQSALISLFGLIVTVGHLAIAGLTERLAIGLDSLTTASLKELLLDPLLGQKKQFSPH